MRAEFKGSNVWSEYYWNDQVYLLNPFQVSMMYFDQMQYCELMAYYSNKYAQHYEEEFDVWTNITGYHYI